MDRGVVEGTSAMEDVAFWRREAAKFRDDAEAAKDAPQAQELRELAAVCEQVAAEIEDRAPAG
jgi:hypothetical protein